MASKRIDISISGKGNLKNLYTKASGDIKKLKSDVQKSVQGANTELNKTGQGVKIKTTGVNTSLDSIKNKAKTVASSIKQTFSGLGGALTSIFAGFTLSDMVTSAGQVESRWNRINIETEKNGRTISSVKKLVRQAADDYGILTGEASATYEKMVRFAGVSAQTDKNFRGILATSKLTGLSTDEIYSAIQSGELGRNKQLQKSVLTEAQRKKYLADGKITQEEINQILAENTGEVYNNNELVNDSESSWNRMMNKINSIKNTIGTSMLPVINTAASIIGKMADGFTWLNTVTGGVAGEIAGIGLALLTIGTPLMLLGSVLKSGWDAAKGIKDSIMNLKPKNVRINCTQSPSCKVAGGNCGGGTGTMGTIEKIGWTMAPGFTTAAIMGGTKAVAMHLATKIGTTFSGVAGASMPGIIEGLFQNPTPKIKGSGSLLSGNWDWNYDPKKGNEQYAKAYGQNQNNWGYDAMGNPIDPKTGKTTPKQGSTFKFPKITTKDVLNEINKYIKGMLFFPGNMSWTQIMLEVSKKIKGFLGLPGNMSWSQILQKVKEKIAGYLGLPGNVSYGQILQKVKEKIFGFLSLPGGISLGTIKSWILGKVGLGGGPGLKYGAAAVSTGPFGHARGPFDGIRMSYENYQGHQKNAITGNGLSGNCVDLSLGMIQLAGGGELKFTTWNGGPHAYARIGGKNYDPARKVLENTWLPPARGPGGSMAAFGIMNRNLHIHFDGPIYGYNDFKNKVEKIVDDVTSDF